MKKIIEIKPTLEIKSQDKNIFQSSEDGKMRERIIKVIESAKKKLFVSSFLIEDKKVISALYEAIKNDVNVYLMVHNSDNLNAATSEDPFNNKVRQSFIDFLNKEGKEMVILHSDKAHAKYVVADEKLSFITTSNLGEAGLIRAEEIGFLGSLEQTESIVKHFKYQVKNHADMISAKNASKVTFEKEFNEKPQMQNLWSGKDIDEKMAEIIRKEDSGIKLTSYSIIEGSETFKALKEKAIQGVEIEIITRTRWVNNDKTTSLNGLKEIMFLKNVKTHFTERMHAKVVITNEGTWMTSANITSFEDEDILTKLTDEQGEFVKKAFDEWKQNSIYKTSSTFKPGDKVLNKDFKEEEVLPEYDVKEWKMLMKYAKKEMIDFSEEKYLDGKYSNIDQFNELKDYRMRNELEKEERTTKD